MFSCPARSSPLCGQCGVRRGKERGLFSQATFVINLTYGKLALHNSLQNVSRSEIFSFCQAFGRIMKIVVLLLFISCAVLDLTQAHTFIGKYNIYVDLVKTNFRQTSTWTNDYNSCSPVPLSPLFPLFPLLPLLPLFPLFPCFPDPLSSLFPLSSCPPCFPVPPVSPVTLFPMFSLFPCFPCSPVSVVPCFLVSPVPMFLVPLFPLLPCSSAPLFPCFLVPLLLSPCSGPPPNLLFPCTPFPLFLVLLFACSPVSLVLFAPLVPPGALFSFSPIPLLPLLPCYRKGKYCPRMTKQKNKKRKNSAAWNAFVEPLKHQKPKHFRKAKKFLKHFGKNIHGKQF